MRALIPVIVGGAVIGAAYLGTGRSATESAPPVVQPFAETVTPFQAGPGPAPQRAFQIDASEFSWKFGPAGIVPLYPAADGKFRGTARGLSWVLSEGIDGWHVDASDGIVPVGRWNCYGGFDPSGTNTFLQRGVPVVINGRNATRVSDETPVPPAVYVSP